MAKGKGILKTAVALVLVGGIATAGVYTYKNWDTVSSTVKGWFTTDDTKEPVDPEAPLTYEVKFVVDGEEKETKQVATGGHITAPEEPTKDGYTFKGWTIDGENIIDLETYEVTENITLTAKFEEQKAYYTVIFDVDGVKTEQNTTGAIEVPENPTKDGYIFSGWTVDGEHIVDLNDYVLTEDTTFIAMFTEIPRQEFTVKFNVDGTETESAVTEGEKITAPEEPTKDGYTFKGWTIDGENIIDLETYEVTENTTLTALFGIKYASLSDFTIDNGTITSYSGKGGIVNIPESYSLDEEGNIIEGTDIAITEIGDYAFFSNSDIIQVKLPTKLKTIGTGAFKSATNLSEADIPNSVTDIGTSAFYGCINLKTAKIGNGLRQIQDSTFYNCYSLEEIVFSDNVEALYTKVFTNCINLKSLNIPAKLTSIYSNTFEGCVGLETITVDKNNSVYSDGDGNVLIKKSENYVLLGSCNAVIPNGVTSISSSAFAGNVKLKSIIIPDSVTAISTSMFKNCTSLESVTIGSGVTEFGWYAFENCFSLTSIEIPDNVLNIGMYAFKGCSALKSVVIGNGVTTIDTSAFVNCTSLSTITFGNSLEKIDNTAFSYCTSLTSIELPDSLKSIGSAAFSNCTKLASINLGNGLESINSHAFEYCYALKILEIPASVSTIGSYIFYRCSDVPTVIVNALTPPTLSSGLAENTSYIKSIYVPDEAYDDYINDSVWSSYASILHKLSELDSEEEA